MIVYKITFKTTGQSYVGQTVKTLTQRWNSHVWTAFNEKEKGYNCFLQKAIRKYGPDAFTIETLHICESKEEMDFVETFYISFLNTKAPNGYNLTDGGEGTLGWIPSKGWYDKQRKAKINRKVSEETKRKISETLKGNTNAVGIKISEEHRLAISRANKGKKYLLGFKHSEKTRKKLSEITKRQWAVKKAMIG